MTPDDHVSIIDLTEGGPYLDARHPITPSDNFIYHHLHQLPDTLDSLQFAYCPNLYSRPAIAHLYYTALNHLDSIHHHNSLHTHF